MSSNKQLLRVINSRPEFKEIVNTYNANKQKKSIENYITVTEEMCKLLNRDGDETYVPAVDHQRITPETLLTKNMIIQAINIHAGCKPKKNINNQWNYLNRDFKERQLCVYRDPDTLENNRRIIVPDERLIDLLKVNEWREMKIRKMNFEKFLKEELKLNKDQISNILLEINKKWSDYNLLKFVSILETLVDKNNKKFSYLLEEIKNGTFIFTPIGLDKYKEIKEASRKNPNSFELVRYGKNQTHYHMRGCEKKPYPFYDKNRVEKFNSFLELAKSPNFKMDENFAKAISLYGLDTKPNLLKTSREELVNKLERELNEISSVEINCVREYLLYAYNPSSGEFVFDVPRLHAFMKDENSPFLVCAVDMNSSHGKKTYDLQISFTTISKLVSPHCIKQMPKTKEPSSSSTMEKKKGGGKNNKTSTSDETESDTNDDDEDDAVEEEEEKKVVAAEKKKMNKQHRSTAQQKKKN